MTPEELSAIRKMGDTCRAKGCRCLARCYHAFNKWWMEKAAICTHPNWCPADDEWWENLPPIIGSKPKPGKNVTIETRREGNRYEQTEVRRSNCRR